LPDGTPDRSLPTRVLLACSGLDHARRGYETFARECFEALRDDPRLDLELVKGSGARGYRERALFTLRRDGALAQAMGRAFGFRPFRLEALAFAFAMYPLLVRRRPELVYLSEWDTAVGLAKLRSLTRQQFRLLLCNGGFASSGFEHLDRVQELTPAALEFVLAQGADPRRHFALPLGFAIDPVPRTLSADDRSALRRRLGLPRERTIWISVAALNHSHKRLGYLIDEAASLQPPRPFLLLVGEPDDETPALRALAADRLEADGYDFRTVSPGEVPLLLRASDVFMLASLAEMQGRAAVEAMAQGLPCVVHDSPVMQFAVGEHGIRIDMRSKGALADALSHTELPTDGESAASRHRHVYERFSWDRLRTQYVRAIVASARDREAKTTVSSSTAEKVSR